MNDLQGSQKAKPNLKSLIRTASVALAQLDAAQLEELAESCLALKRFSIASQELRAAEKELGVFTQVLKATRSNIEVLHRLRAIELGKDKGGRN